MKRPRFLLSMFVLFIVVLISLFILVRNTSYAATPDFRTLTDVKEKKLAFWGYFRPIVEEVNANTLVLRKKLLFLQKKEHLSKKERLWVSQLSKQYGLKSPAGALDFNGLLERVDILPTSLILAQAANESAWGTSKFARLANNYFGQWCFTLHCGMVPSKRDSHKIHEVRQFASPYDSVNAYLLNINKNTHYTLLRKIRADLRNKKKPLRGNALAVGLASYSERGNDYIKEIQAMIRVNQLEENAVG